MRRRLLIVGLIFLVLAAIVGGVYVAFSHQPPTCTDNTQNQDEEGIDCGGVCTYLCNESRTEPSVKFARAITPTPGRTDVIAYVDNPNHDAAAKSLGYTIQLYSPDNSVVASKEGKVDLPPESTVPIYVPNFFSGSQVVARVFLTFDEPKHYWLPVTNKQTLPAVEGVQYQGGEAPRITATAFNRSGTTLRDVTFVVTVFNEVGNAIGASQTVVRSLPAQSRAPLVFTWSEPFVDTVSRIEVLPVAPLSL